MTNAPRLIIKPFKSSAYHRCLSPPPFTGEGQGGGNFHRRFSKRLLCLTLVIICSICSINQCLADDPNSFSQTKHFIAPQEQMKFADQYFNNKQFDRAIAEYERFIFFFPQDLNVPHAQYQLARAYFNNRQFTDALQHFKDIAESNPGSPRSISGHFDVADCFFQLRDFSAAVKTLSHVTHLSQNTDIQDYAYYQTGWIFVEDQQWEYSKSVFNKISDQNLPTFQTDSLLAALDKAKDIPQKSPALSGVLSIVPGGGYLYCGRPKDAFMSLILNTGLIWAAIEAFENDSPALGGVITFVEIGFYGGNIFGGISSAHKYNKRSTDHFIDRLKKNHRIHFSVKPADSELEISIQTPFQ